MDDATLAAGLGRGAGSVMLRQAERIAELEDMLSISRDLNRKYVGALRAIADYSAAVEIMDTDEVAAAEYSRALQGAKLIARQALPIIETK